MTCKIDQRRNFLRGAAAGTLGALAAPALAQSGNSHASPNKSPGGASKPMHRVLGRPGHVEDRQIIAMLIHPKLVMQDLIGPMTVFNLMGSEIHMVWKDYDPILTELGIPLFPTTTFAECPKKVDILFVPGGLGGSVDYMDDPEVLEFLADIGANAKYVTSVCTGSLLLGAAGLLKGYKATSHWYVREQLDLFGAMPVDERYVIDRNRVTGGGVTAGIDFGLALAAEIRSPLDAQRYQLVIEYAPAPPFNAGLPETAPKEAYDRIMRGRAPIIEASRKKAEQISSSWPSS